MKTKKRLKKNVVRTLKAILATVLLLTCIQYFPTITSAEDTGTGEQTTEVGADIPTAAADENTAPATEPTIETTVEPTAAPEETVAPAVEPTAEPTVTPAAEETAEPAVDPTVEPTTEPTVEPTVEPTTEPTMVPEETVEETTEPTATPAADKYAYYVYNQYYDVAGNQVGSNVTVEENYENTAATVDVTFDTIITYEAKQYKARLLEGETEVDGKVTRNVALTANTENYIYVEYVEVVEEETVEPVEEEPAMPEISYNNTVAGINVSIYAPEGAFPNGTTVVVTPISENEAVRLAEMTIDTETEKVVSAVAVDITFYNNGTEVQPLLPIEVSINKALEGETFNVYHVDENENVELVTEEATEAGATFEADTFSIYLVTGITKKYTTYKFYVDETEVSSQIVKTGYILYAPLTPEKDGFKFIGWYDESDKEFTNFNTSLTINEDKEVKLYAKFEPAHYIFFADKNGTIYHTESVAINEEVTLADFGDNFIPKTASQAVTGWYSEKELINKVEKITISNTDVTVYAKVEDGSWLSFDTDG